MTGGTADCEFRVYTRRQMLDLMLRSGAGLAATAVGLKAMDWFVVDAEAAANTADPRKAMFAKRLSGKRVKCMLCPHNFTIKNGSNCFCKSRKNIDGNLYAMGFDKPCIVNFVPIEQGPLYHFLPGAQTMALGAAGCNMRCLYCQNYTLAFSAPEEVRRIDFDEKKAMKQGKIKAITLTYTDSSCQPEYLIYVAELAQKLGFKGVLCTGGYINSEPLKAVTRYIDAFVITLKAATEDAYRKLTGVHLKPVLNTIKQVKKSGKHLELVTLIVPGYNDDRKGIKSIAEWIKTNTGTKVPWHLSRFTPNYKLKKIPATPRKTLEEARKVGLDSGLQYVYITNLAPHEGNHTYCPNCGKKVLERLGFKLRESHLKNGKCGFCGHPIPGVWF